MAITNYAQSWTDVYEKYQSVVNFVAGDFDSLKNDTTWKSFLDYCRANNIIIKYID